MSAYLVMQHLVEDRKQDFISRGTTVSPVLVHWILESGGDSGGAGSRLVAELGREPRSSESKVSAFLMLNQPRCLIQ